MSAFDASSREDPACAPPEDPFGDAAREAFDAARNELALTKLGSFRETVLATPELTASQRRFLSDDTLLRYLRARDGDEAAALDMLRATLEWRAAHIDGVAGGCAPCAECASAHCFFRIGTDARGRHVVYSCAARSTNKAPPDNAKHMAFELERLFDGNRLPGRIVWLIDFAGFGARDLNPSMALGTIPMFAAHYPERLGQLLLVNPPWLFFGLYKAVTPVMDPVTRSKIMMLRSDAARAEYADALWPEDEREPMRAWLEAQLLRPPVPCSFPDLKLSRRLDDEATIATLERCCPQAAQ